MNRKKEPQAKPAAMPADFGWIGLPLSFLISGMMLFASADWITQPAERKLRMALILLAASFVLSMLLIRLLKPLVEREISLLSKKSMIRRVVLTGVAAILIAIGTFFYLPTPLQPANQISLIYSSIPATGFPDVRIRPIVQQDQPEHFRGTHEGIPGLMTLSEESGHFVLTGKTNFLGNLEIDFAGQGKTQPSQIRWNGSTLAAPFENPLVLAGNRDPFRGKSLFLKGILVGLFVCNFFGSWLILLIALLYVQVSFAIFTRIPTPQTRSCLREWQLLSLLFTTAVLLNPIFQFPVADKALLFLLTLSALWLADRLHHASRATILQKYAEQKKFAASLAAAGWLAFALFGNSTLVLTSTSNWLPPVHWMLFCLGIAWAFPLVMEFLWLLEALQQKIHARSERNKKWRVWTGFFIIFLLTASIYLVAYNPAISSMDSQGQWWQATGQTPVDDAHSVFHTLCIRWLIAIFPTPLFIAIVQVLWYAGLSAAILTWLWQKGVSRGCLAVFAFLLSILSNNGLTLITIWKDIPYTLSLLWLTFILVRLITAGQEYAKRWTTICTSALSLFFISQFRHNGLLAAIFVCLYLTIWSFQKKCFRPLLGVGLFAAMMALFNGPVSRAVEVVPLGSGNIIIGLTSVNDMLAVDRLGGTLPREAEKVFEALSLDPAAADFSFFQNDTTWRRQVDLSSVSPGQFVQAYALTFLQNPFHMLRALLLRLDNLWAVRESPFGGFIDSVNWTDADLYGFPRRQIFLKPWLDNFQKVVTESSLYPVVWRGGTLLALLLIALIFLSANRKTGYFTATIPLWGNVFSLYLATYPTYRYTWPTSLLFGFLILFFLTGKPVSE